MENYRPISVMNFFKWRKDIKILLNPIYISTRTTHHNQVEFISTKSVPTLGNQLINFVTDQKDLK